MTIAGFCNSCFTRVTLDHRPRIGLCVVCPNCDAALERLHFAAAKEDWFFEDGDAYEENIFFSVQSKEIPS